jgi:hypothetical protein
LPDYSPGQDFERRHVRPKPGRTLIVGSQVYAGKEDRRKRYADVVGIDMLEGPGVDVVADLEEPQAIGAFSHIECMSVLEHSKRPWLLAANLQTMLEVGGTIYVAVPFIWRFHGYPSDFWRFTFQGIGALFPDIEWKAAAYAHKTLTLIDAKVPAKKIEGFPYYPRTETLAFGVKA